MDRPSSIRQRLAIAPAAAPLRSAVLRVLAAREFDAGRISVPAERAKRRHLLGLLADGNHRVFVESGTYLGGTVAFMAPHVDRIISVEIDSALFERAQARFAGDTSIELVLGDALEEIPRIVAGLDEAPLIWLDGHASGGITGHGMHLEPALEMLVRLREAGLVPGTTIVIDDLRVFGRLEGYPALGELMRTVLEEFPAGEILAGLDSLVIRP